MVRLKKSHPVDLMPSCIRALLAVAVLLLVMACEGDDGAPSTIYGQFSWSTDVLEIDASSLGIASIGTHPDPGIEQELTSARGSVTWSSDFEGAAKNYAVILNFEPLQVDEGEDGFLPNTYIEIYPLTVEDGNDRGDLSFRFVFEQDELHIYTVSRIVTGTP